jgi:large subunit ribosomal protein L29
MKASELLMLNKTELEGKLRDLKGELFNLRFQLATGQLQNTMVIKGVKRDIARCMTALSKLDQKDAR